jgi:hypothetical protein
MSECAGDPRRRSRSLTHCFGSRTPRDVTHADRRRRLLTGSRPGRIIPAVTRGDPVVIETGPSHGDEHLRE